eukprot:3181570-Rhodomonas_salina.2
MFPGFGTRMDSNGGMYSKGVGFTRGLTGSRVFKWGYVFKGVSVTRGLTGRPFAPNVPSCPITLGAEQQRVRASGERG